MPPSFLLPIGARQRRRSAGHEHDWEAAGITVRRPAKVFSRCSGSRAAAPPVNSARAASLLLLPLGIGQEERRLGAGPRE